MYWKYALITTFDGICFEFFTIFCVGQLNLGRLRTNQMHDLIKCKRVNPSQTQKWSVSDKYLTVCKNVWNQLWFKWK